MNALRHGLLSRAVVLPNESQEIFDMLLGQYLSKLSPADGVEHGAVEELMASTWRMRRLWSVETNLLTKAVARRTEPDEMDRIAGAFSDLCERPELNHIHRYEARLSSRYQRALENLFVFAEIPECQTNLDSNNPNADNDLDSASSAQL